MNGDWSKIPYALGDEALGLILRANAHRNGTKAGVGAQHRVTSDAWCGCILLAVIGARCTIRIANGDEFNVPTHDVRIPLAS